MNGERPIEVRSLDRRLRVDRRAVVRALRLLDRGRDGLRGAASALENCRELSVVFLADAELARLHARFLSDPSPTDVITFPGASPLGPAGEICVSAGAAARAAAARGGDFSEELTLYLVHGWLHLAGHDDRRPALKRAMRRAEARALGRLRREGGIPRFSWRA